MSFEDLRTAAHLLRGPPGFLRSPVTLQEARRTLDHRLVNREARFLTLVDAAIYGHAASPFRPLLPQTGCQPGDLRQLLTREGLEDALGVLACHGLYLTVDELTMDAGSDSTCFLEQNL